MEQFLEKFFFGEGKLAVSIESLHKSVYVDKPIEVPSDRNVFFGPAMRRVAGNTTEDILGFF